MKDTLVDMINIMAQNGLDQVHIPKAPSDGRDKPKDSKSAFPTTSCFDERRKVQTTVQRTQTTAGGCFTSETAEKKNESRAQ